MHLISIRNLRTIAAQYPDATKQIEDWYTTVKKSDWQSLADIRHTIRISGKMTLTFNPQIYSHLLAEISPKVIETESEYDQALIIAERLTFNHHKTPEERSIYQLLVMLIEVYETRHYPIPTSPPHEVLQHTLEASGRQKSDLVGKLGSGEVVAEIINGTRAISMAQAKVLSEIFKVSPNLFL